MSGSKLTNWRYPITATCKSNTITIGTAAEKTDIEVSKETIALVVVLSDLAIAFILWFALLGLKPLHKFVDDDVNKGTLTATDFSAVVDVDPHTDHINDLKGIIWAWAENILEKEPEHDADPAHDPSYDPRSYDEFLGKCTELDFNVDRVFNVNLGLSNLEYLGLQEKMGNLLVQKKKLDIKVKDKKNTEE